MAKPRNRVLDYLAYIGLRLFAMFVHMQPWTRIYKTATIIGNLIYKYDKRHRHRAIEHLRRSFPDWPEAKLHKVVQASMRNLTYLAVEMLFTTQLITPGRWRMHVKPTNMSETIRLLLEQKTGLIFLTGHFGNWEVSGYSMAALGFPSVVVARPLDNTYISDYVYGIRTRKGMKIVDKKGATEQADQILANKGLIGFVADQDAGRKGMFVDFFGRKASTYKAFGLLAMQHNVPVVIGYARRLDEQYRFELCTQRIIHPHEWADKDDPLRYITQEYCHAMEEVIRKAPEQYLWAHRRWKHRPKGEPPAPDGIA